MNGGSSDEPDQLDGEIQDDSVSQLKEEQNQIVSELCRDAMGLELSEAVSQLPVPDLSLVSLSTHSLTIQQISSSNGREDQSDDEDTEVTVTTEVPDEVDTVDSPGTPIQCTSRIPEANIPNLDSSIISSHQISNGDLLESSKMVWKVNESVQPGQSVDSSTDTLVAPDQLANHSTFAVASPATPLCNGIR